METSPTSNSLFLIAMKGFASDYKDAGIFNNALYGLLSSIVVGVLAGGLMVAVIFMNWSRRNSNL